jgi:hypothetical protein
MNHRMKILTILLAAIALTSSSCRGQQPKSVDDPALAAAVDSLMPQLEKLSGLKKLKPITMRHQTREELRKYVTDRLREEMPPEEMDGIHAAYAALGLVPDTVDLEKLLLDLYTEQVAGYYDPKTDAFYMVEGTPRDLLRPTLAHELVHALQDQHADLDSLISRKRGNDRQTAAQAAIEGHATLVMFALLADPSGNFDVNMLPDMGEQLRPLMEAQNSQFPVFQSAPRIIRETMLFPYVTGAGFVQHVWRAQSKTANKYAAPLGARLPQSTEQVMHPATHFLNTRDHPTELAFTSAPPGKLLYENTLGELEVSILLAQHLGNSEAAGGWDGDRYRVVDVDGKRVLLWQTVWDDPAAADRFAKAYQAIAAKRPNRAIHVVRNEITQRPGVWVVDAPSGVDAVRFSPLAVQLR